MERQRPRELRHHFPLRTGLEAVHVLARRERVPGLEAARVGGDVRVAHRGHEPHDASLPLEDVAREDEGEAAQIRVVAQRLLGARARVDESGAGDPGAMPRVGEPVQPDTERRPRAERHGEEAGEAERVAEQLVVGEGTPDADAYALCLEMAAGAEDWQGEAEQQSSAFHHTG